MFCWLYKLKISGAMDGNGKLPRAAERHIRHCAPCREFHNDCLSLAYGLRTETMVSKDHVSERLTRRILTAIQHQRTGIQPTRIRLWPIAAAASVILFVLVGALFLAKHYRGQNGGENEPTFVISGITDLAEGNFARPWSQLVEKPLASELQNLQNDTQSAVRFLVTCVAVNVTTPENGSIN